MTTQSTPSSFTAGHTRPLAHRGQNLITILLGFWLMIGLFVDGWAHQHLPSTLETFFTPWHGLFYAGYAATAAWIVFLISRNVRRGARGLAAIPLGYEAGVAGIFLFGAGGVGDMLWHTIFGIEKDVEALLSPTHLLLLSGMQLIVLSPFLAAWKNPDRTQDAPRFKAFLPTLLSATASLSFMSFFHMYLWGTTTVLHASPAVARWEAQGSVTSALAQQYNLVAILFTTVLLLVPVLLMVQRWRLPFGSVTLIFGLNGVLMAALGLASTPDISTLALLASPLAAGLVADALLGRQAAQPRPAGIWLLGFVTPVVFWGVHFLCVALLYGEGWSVELWSGITFMSGLIGFALSLLSTPPSLPRPES
ncbi:hypothetical protein DEDE109153_15970 [Deinococcus deserti]|uniref:Uncharacterized protein n=1 Tax=Deinococcus deserti (strain DSM 17065 / CIP 109153 / LMG 22923 / VCD115) TaxID=546414 RepID=C1CWY7_DEIDV|nr:hypothetical protein [Deinococcus deserti]ACO46704.1 Conserved hypothetical protein; putative membrane protein [Deinococcus deserti VCD115]